MAWRRARGLGQLLRQRRRRQTAGPGNVRTRGARAARQFAAIENALTAYVALAPPVETISTPKSTWLRVEPDESQPCVIVQLTTAKRSTVPEVNPVVEDI